MTAKDLKNALLQEAVQGKLVPQISNEGNAKDLLEEIKKEKAKLVKDGKIKKEKPLPEITDDEVSFELPENWCWCRLGEVASIQSSKRVFEKDYVAEGIPFFRSKEIGDLSRNEEIHTKLFITKEHYEKLKEIYGVPEKGDILLTSVGSIGNTWICDGRRFYYKDGNVTQICHNKVLIPEYVNLFLKSPLFNQQVFDTVTGTAYSALTIIKINSLLFPLPPLAEQKRIVAAIENFMPLIEEYGKKEETLKLLNTEIGLLSKKSILQEAVQGKLVPQIASEGNAKDLLEEIKKEKAKLLKDGKIKKEKPLPEITDEEAPFEIPENWCWCRLGEICDYLHRGKSPKYGNEKILPIMAQKCNQWDKIYTDRCLFADKKSIERYLDEQYLQKGDTIINSTGGGTVGRTGYVDKYVFSEYKKIVADSHVTVVRGNRRVIGKYIYYFLITPLIQIGLEGRCSGSTNQIELGTETIRNYTFPLPPLAEQKHIVAAIEKLLPLCDRLGE